MKRAAQVVAGVHLCATGMLLLGKPEQVRRKTDLGFHFFLAVTKIVVGDDRDHTTVFIAAGELEGTTVIVEFIRILPAHAVAHLPFVGLAEVRQSQILFLQLNEVGRKDDPPGVPRPVSHIQSGVVDWQMRVAPVAKDAFHKIQIGRHGGRRKKTNLERFLLCEPFNCRANDRTQQKGNPSVHRPFRFRCKRQLRQPIRSLKGSPKNFPGGIHRHGFFIVGNRQAIFHHVEHPLGCALILRGIVQDALCHAVRIQDLVAICLAVLGQCDGPRKTVLIEQKSVLHQSRTIRAEHLIHELLDALINRRQFLGRGSTQLGLNGG